MKTVKKVIDLLGVTFEELRGKSIKRRVTDARTLMAAWLHESQHVNQLCIASLINVNQSAVSKMLRRHKNLLECDSAYRKKWSTIKTISL